MKCPECGMENKDDAKKCAGCDALLGEPIPDPDTSIQEQIQQKNPLLKFGLILACVVAVAVLVGVIFFFITMI